ncbi:MAG: O-antigen ligase family protein [Deltaproteobacteria bacterium]|nr:O-antigen ligase family protein [Deltaproteobacteria bacterium]
MGLLANTEDLIVRYRLMTVFLAVFLFLQPFQKFAGVRSTAFVLLCLAFVVKLVRGGNKTGLKDPSVIGLILIIAVSLLSSALSPYPQESFDALRKNLLYQAVVFFVIVNCYRGYVGLKPLFYALMGGFAALSVYVVFKYDPEVFLNWLSHSDRGDAPFLKGYSLYATFYIPLAVAYLYASNEGWKLKSALVFFIFLELTLSVLNNHRGQLVAIVLSGAAITVFAKRYYLLLAGLMVCVALSLALLRVNPQSFDRYKTLLSPHTYVTNEHTGLNDRLAIWEGAFDMIKDRPVLGWGYGWKKLSTVANEKGYIDRWDKSGPTYRYYTQKGYGSANPHNLAIQILFETGVLGLLAFLFFWGTVVVKAASAGVSASAGTRLLKYGASGVLLSYLLINYANGLWEESFGILMVAFAASMVVLYREAECDEEGAL